MNAGRLLVMLAFGASLGCCARAPQPQSGGTSNGSLSPRNAIECFSGASAEKIADCERRFRDVTFIGLCTKMGNQRWPVADALEDGSKPSLHCGGNECVSGARYRVRGAVSRVVRKNVSVEDCTELEESRDIISHAACLEDLADPLRILFSPTCSASRL